MAGKRTYPYLRKIIKALELENIKPMGEHHHTHFHIDFRTPDLMGIGGARRLHVDDSGPQIESAIEGEDTMFFIGAMLASAVAQAAPTVQLTAAAPTQLPSKIVDKIEKSYQVEPTCMGAETLGSLDSNPQFPSLTLDPQLLLADDLVGQGIRPAGPMAVSVLGGPFHGTLKRYEGSSGVTVLGHKSIPGEVRFESNASYGYQSDKGFEGHDQVTFLVTSNNTRFRITVLIAVGQNKSIILQSDDCEFIAPIPPRPQSSVPIDGQQVTAQVVSVQLMLEGEATDDLAAWQRSAELSTLIGDANMALTWADLPASALGQTTGEGTSATITLDTTAAGHGWYIDPTGNARLAQGLPAPLAARQAVWQHGALADQWPANQALSASALARALMG